MPEGPLETIWGAGPEEGGVMGGVGGGVVTTGGMYGEASVPVHQVKSSMS